MTLTVVDSRASPQITSGSPGSPAGVCTSSTGPPGAKVEVVVDVVVTAVVVVDAGDVVVSEMAVVGTSAAGGAVAAGLSVKLRSNASAPPTSTSPAAKATAPMRKGLVRSHCGR